MYTAEQYKKAKSLVEGMLETDPARANDWLEQIQEYEVAHEKGSHGGEAIKPDPLKAYDLNYAADPSKPSDGRERFEPVGEDYVLPNASGLKELSAPYEYVSRTPGASLKHMAQMAVQSGRVTGGLHAGVYFEPTEAQFKVDMAPKLKALDALPGTATYSQELAEYRDRKWMQAYAQAKANDTPLTRVEFIPKDAKLLDKISAAAGTAADKIDAFSRGLARTITFHQNDALDAISDKITGGNRVDVNREQQARDPYAVTAGEVAGAAVPFGSTARLAGGIGGASLRALPWAGRLGASVLSGAGTSMALTAANRITSDMGDAAHNRAPDPDARTNFTQQMLTSGLLGGVTGGLGEAAASGLAKWRENIRGAGPFGANLSNAERAGSATSGGAGLIPGNGIKAAIDEARAPVPGEGRDYPMGDAVELQAAKLRGPLADKNAELNTAAHAQMEAETADMLGRDRTLHSPQHVTNTRDLIYKELFARSGPSAEGKVLPSEADSLATRKNQNLLELYRKLTKPRRVLAEDAAHEARIPGSHVVTMEEAAALGFNVKGLEHELNPEGVPNDAPSLSGFESVSDHVGTLAKDSPHYDAINRFLNETRAANSRAERIGIERATSADMNAFLKHAESSGARYDKTVFRGGSPSELEQVLQGGETPSTWSVSKAREGAMPFAKKHGVMFEIEGGAVPVDGVPGSNTYEEALIHKGAPLQVVGERTEDGIRIVQLRRAEQSVPGGGVTRPEISDGRDTLASNADATAAHQAALEVPKGLPAKEFKIILEPAKLNAVHFDNQVEAFNQAANEGSARGAKDPIWDKVQAAIRKDRDRFSPPWGKMKSNHHEVLTGLEKTQADAGLSSSDPYGGLTPAGQRQFTGALVNSGPRVGPMDTNIALDKLAKAAGKQGELNTLQGTHGYNTLREQALPSPKESIGAGGTFLRLGGFTTAVKLRADAAARAMARGPQGEPLFLPDAPAAMANEPYGRSLRPSGPIMNLFSVGRGALGVKSGSLYDSATGRRDPGGSLTPEQAEQVRRALEQ